MNIIETTDREIDLNDLARRTIENRLGGLEDLPPPLHERVFDVYREFLKGYLGFLEMDGRTKVETVEGPVPIFPDIVDGMRHFFSDYQHLTRQFVALERRIARIRRIDPEGNPKIREDEIEELMDMLEV